MCKHTPINNTDLQDFLDFAEDHYNEFEAWPVEFESSTGVWDSDFCWLVLNMTGMLDNERN
jgi:hypothetical protein